MAENGELLEDATNVLHDFGPTEFAISAQLGIVPPGIKEILGDKKVEILEVAGRYGATSVRVFGSVARGEAEADSDVDFLVELEEGRSLFDLGGLLMELQDLLGRKVDVVTPKGLHWYIRDRVIGEARPL